MILKNTLTTMRLSLISISTLFMLFGVVILIFKQRIFQSILYSQLTISEGTAAYNAWVETAIPVYTKIYFFDMLNPRELFYSHEKPIIEERGPYTFREVQKKVDIKWNPNGTVSYRRQKYWYFERDMSVGPLTDVITTINIPVVSSAEVARGSFFMEWGISDMLATVEANLFINKTVGELLFEGYEDTIMEIGSSLTGRVEDDEDDGFYMDDEEEDDEEVEEEVVDDENSVVLDKFGWFYKRNGTSWADGKVEMRTGQDDISNLGKIVTWNDATSNPAYKGECGRVRGSSDGLFPPGTANMVDTLELYSTDLCRPLNFTKTGIHSVHGIPVTKFHLDPNNFANSTTCPNNECFQNNLPSGVQNVTQCKMKSPSFVSRPHFYLADQSYLQQFQYGLKPDPAKHDSVLWMEPLTSIPAKVEIRLQLNILLKKIDGIEYLFKNLPEVPVMFPVLWFEAESSLPEHVAGSLQMLISLPDIMRWCGVCSILSSTAIIFSLIWISCHSRDKKHPSDEKNETKTPMEKSTDYEYCRVPSNESRNDKAPALSESCSLNP